jgi:hypothetical protein
MSIEPSFPTRLILEGVPKVGFYDQNPSRCPEDICFPSCMRSLLEFLPDEGYGCMHTARTSTITFCTYAYIAGISGAAWHNAWGEGWQTDNAALIFMSDDPDAPYERTLRNLGYEYEFLHAEDRGRFRQAAVESIQRGVPVVAIGVIGPPEACLIAGYDQGGDVAVGWSFFQYFPDENPDPEFEPNGMFRKRDWVDACEGMILLGEKSERPKQKEILRDAMRWAVEIARTPEVTRYGGKRWTGLASYEAWAEHLLRDDEFVGVDDAALWQRFLAHDFAVGALAEARWYGSVFLAQSAGVDDRAAQEILQAAACYAEEHALMWKVWGAVGGIGQSPEKAQKLAEPEVRREIANLVLCARDKDVEAVGYLEQALQRKR